MSTLVRVLKLSFPRVLSAKMFENALLLQRTACLAHRRNVWSNHTNNTKCWQRTTLVLFHLYSVHSVEENSEQMPAEWMLRYTNLASHVYACIRTVVVNTTCGLCQRLLWHNLHHLWFQLINKHNSILRNIPRKHSQVISDHITIQWGECMGRLTTGRLAIVKPLETSQYRTR
jgi:hypothetical protein